MAPADSPPYSGAPRRRAVVVRAGPPKHRTRPADVLAGIAGALLLILAVGLVFLLPEPDEVMPQFRIRVSEHPSEEGQYPTQHLDGPLAQGESHDFVFDVPHDNVFVFSVRVAASDDKPSTLPDRFTIRVFAPNGTEVGEPRSLETAPPRLRGSGDVVDDPTNSPYTSDTREVGFQFRLTERPTDQAVAGVHAEETVDEAAQRILPGLTFPSSGDWVVRVTLDEAGDCPDPDADPDRLFQALVCRQEHGPDGTDGSNDTFRVLGFSYFRYEARLEDLDP